ncbi:uncharacterized protein [Dermacentor albipictus]
MSVPEPRSANCRTAGEGCHRRSHDGGFDRSARCCLSRRNSRVFGDAPREFPRRSPRHVPRRRRSKAGRARSARREKRKRRALRALGDPMESACVALLVLCALLVIGVLAYLLRFAQADAAGVGGARKRLPARPNITADADTTTGAAMIVLPALGGATDSAKGGARNIAAGNGSAEGASTIS